jgi:protein phosphatase
MAGAASPLKVDSCGATDPGRVRPTNEDQFLIARLTKSMQVLDTSLPQESVQYGKDQGHLFVVADGMGGHAAGETASALVIDSIEKFVLNTCKWFFQLQGQEGDEVLAEFQMALQQADGRVLAEAARHHELAGMGTTLTMAYSLDSDLFVAHVGDSRCYLFRNGVLHRLTQDHTMVQELVRQGYMEAEEAAHHRLRHVITNAIGGNTPGIDVEVHKVKLEPGDRVLLCTDGLTEMVAEEEITEHLRSNLDLRETCGQLIAQANEQGGKDNITIVLAEFENN